MKDLLSSLFPANDFSLIAVVMALPLLGAFVNGVFGRRLGKDAVRLMTLAVTGASFAAAIATFIALDGAVAATRTSEMVTEAGGAAAHEVIKHGHAKLVWTAWEWMRTSGLRDVSIPIDLKFSVDALSGVMMLVVTPESASTLNFRSMAMLTSRRPLVRIHSHAVQTSFA